jgi:hypothetical protein
LYGGNEEILHRVSHNDNDTGVHARSVVPVIGKCVMLRHLLNLKFTGDSHRPVWGKFNWISVVLTIGFISSHWGASMGYAEASTSIQKPSKTASEDSTANSSLFLKDGIYLYGQSPQPNQIGQAYMVFEVTAGKLVGGFYMPRSSFDCFSGTAQGNQLALNIVDSYSQEVHDYSMAYSNVSTVAANSPGGADQKIVLEGFHPIETLSQTDYQILKTCKADFNQN